MTNRILVTGAVGFIGSSLTDNLLQSDNEVLGVDNFDPYYARAIKERNIAGARQNSKFRLMEGDIRDSSFLESCFNEFNPDIVVHQCSYDNFQFTIYIFQ